MRISDWSSDVCSSDLLDDGVEARQHDDPRPPGDREREQGERQEGRDADDHGGNREGDARDPHHPLGRQALVEDAAADRTADRARSEEHTSELQSLMRISYAVFCLKKKKVQTPVTPTHKARESSITALHQHS